MLWMGETPRPPAPAHSHLVAPPPRPGGASLSFVPFVVLHSFPRGNIRYQNTVRAAAGKETMRGDRPNRPGKNS